MHCPGRASWQVVLRSPSRALHSHFAASLACDSPAPYPCLHLLCSVVWTSGGVLRKQLAVAAPVIKAAWCFFQNTGPDAILCLLHPASLSVFTQDGDSHVIPLPASFTGLWPLPQGVLLTVSAAGACCLGATATCCISC